MKGMTIIEIADLSNVSEKTIRNWIKLASVKFPKLSGKTTEARKHGKAALFDLQEVITIVRAGGQNTLADLLQENANRTSGPSYPGNRAEIAKKSLSGAFIRELRETLGPVEAGRRIDYLLGYSRREEPVSPEVARENLTRIRLSLTEKAGQMTLLEL